MADDPESTSLERWSRNHAVVTLAGATLAAVSGAPWLLLPASLLSFTVLVGRIHPRLEPGLGFGKANWVTLLRLALVAALAVWAKAADAVVSAGILLILALDGLDGWLARRAGLSTRFGARFDMETDAFLVLVTTLLLLDRERAGAWVLGLGALRYVHVICVALFPPRVPDVLRSRWGPAVFAGAVVALALAFLARGFAASALAAAASLAVGSSFAAGFHGLYWRAAGAASSATVNSRS